MSNTDTQMPSHLHCRCMSPTCTNRHFADCPICKPNGNELRRQEQEKNKEDLLAAVKAEFEKFYASSPFVQREGLTQAQVRLAMEGSYMAGYLLLAEKLKGKL